MIPVLILFIIRRLKGNSILCKRITELKKLAIKVIVFIFLLLATSAHSSNDIIVNKVLSYNVVKNNVVIGTIKINKQVFGDSITYTLESNIKAQFLLKFNITGKEKSIYKDGILVYSSVYRTLNNKVKTNHSICLRKGQYNLESSGKQKDLNFGLIKHNLITMYFNEPSSIESIFCDNLNQMAKVVSLGERMYKVAFSKRKYNIFHYKNGKCIKIEAFSSLFNVTLIPVEL